MKSSEIQRNQSKSTEIKRNQAKSSEINRNQQKSSEINRNQAKSNEINGNLWKSSEIIKIKLNQVKSSEIKRNQMKSIGILGIPGIPGIPGIHGIRGKLKLHRFCSSIVIAATKGSSTQDFQFNLDSSMFNEVSLVIWTSDNFHNSTTLESSLVWEYLVSSTYWK